MADGRDGWAHEWFRYARARLAAWRRRATPFGLTLRVVIAVSGFAAIMLAIGTANLRAGLLVAVLLPTIAALRPTGPWTALVVVTSVGGWFLATTLTEPSMTTAILIGASAYTHHATAAVAREWTTDAAIAATVRRAWWRRTGAIVAGGIGVGALVAGLSGQTVPLPAGALLPIGVALILTVLGGIVHLARRTDPSDHR